MANYGFGLSSETKRLLRMAAGGILILLGAAGLALPLVPGWLLIFLGLALLTSSSVLARVAVYAVLRRFPFANRIFREATRRIHAYMQARHGPQPQ